MNFENLLTLVIGSFSIELTFLSQIGTFSINLNHQWKCREQNENFQTVLVIIYQNFTVFQYRSDSRQVERILISSTVNLVYELPHELPNNLTLQKIMKYQKNISLSSRNQTLEIAVKTHTKFDTKLFFSCPVLLDFSILFQIFCPGLQAYLCRIFVIYFYCH